MEIRWTAKALSDVNRLYEFLSVVNKAAAARTLHSLVNAPLRLNEHPRIGEKLEEFEPRDVRRMFVGNYEMRYEIRNQVVHILRVWHTRENR